MKKLHKRLLFILGAIILFVVLVIVFISPITKYTVEKYDIKFAGRQITMDWVYVNPFTGYLHFSNLKIYEYESDSVFISADGLSANIAMYKLPSKTYEISGLTFDQLKINVIQNKNDFNFSDLIATFSSKDTTSLKPKDKEPVHFSILDISINNSEFHYHEKVIPVKYFIKKVNIHSPGFSWDKDTVAAKISFLPGIGKGKLKADFKMNIKTLNYGLAAVIDKFELQFLEQYLKDIANYGSFRANLDANLKVKGNFGAKQAITARGFIGVNDFHFGKNKKEDYASFKKVAIQIIELSPDRKKYLFDSLSLRNPFFKYEKYDKLDNIQTMFGRKGANVKEAKADAEKFNLILELGEYIKVLSKNFFKSNYKINRLAVYDGNIKFNDFSTNEKFSAALNPFSIYADSIDKKYNRVRVVVKSGIKPFGSAHIVLSINPKDSSDFNLYYDLNKIPLTMFNPYTITYTSYPLDRGSLQFKGNWDVKNGIIRSDNHLIVIDPRTAKRVKNKDNKWIPTPLIMAFVRENANVIDYKIPITGNLNDPKFHFRDVIFDILTNIFIKPVTIPYRLDVKSVETEIEKSLSMKWPMRQAVVTPKQERFIEDIAEFLQNTPEASIQIHPRLYTEKEKEYILFFETKKRYYLELRGKSRQSFNEDDSTAVEKMSIKDGGFGQYLNRKVNDSMVFTIQEKCARIIDEAIVNKRIKHLNDTRKEVFIHYFADKGVIDRIKFLPPKDFIPYNGFSFYKIEYKGEFPESIREAYKDLDEFNNEAPRDKFKKERKKFLGIF